MEALFLLLILAAIIYWAVSKKPNPPKPLRTEEAAKPAAEPAQPPEPLADPAAPFRARVAQWQKDHYEAFLLLAMTAMADGKTSREEMRLMARFFAEQGDPASDDELAGIDYLNAGLSLRIAGTPDAADLLGGMSDRPRGYLLGLYGTLYALTGAKRPNARNAALLGAVANTLLASPAPAVVEN